MRLNQFLARATGLSRRAADQVISEGRVSIDGQPAKVGQQVSNQQLITLDGQPLTNAMPSITIMLNKPAGYIVSRQGQGGHTIYDLLPAELHHLKAVGRLDKDSSGLLLLTNDGQLANRLTHPRYAKTKIYEVELDRALTEAAKHQIETGVSLDDGPSHLQLSPLANDRSWQVSMTEGRNRQIRRTFAALGYKVIRLHRSQFGPYSLKSLALEQYQVVTE